LVVRRSQATILKWLIEIGERIGGVLVAIVGVILWAESAEVFG